MPYVLPKHTRDNLVISYQYDAARSIVNMFNWKGTAFSLVFPKPLYWVFVGIHVLLFFLKEYHTCEEPNAIANCTPAREIFAKYPMAIGDISVISSLVTFFVVFYNGNCYNKFEVMYKNVIAIQGHLHNIGLYLRAYYTTPATRWNVMRYPLASQFIFYWSLRHRYHLWQSSQYLSDPGDMAELFFGNEKRADEEAFEGLVPKGILIRAEAEALLENEANVHKLLFSWTIVAMKHIMGTEPPAGEKGNPMLNSDYEQTALMSNLKEEIVGMRGAIGAINAGMLFPVPFLYYHIVNLTLTIFLVLLAYAFLFINDGKGSVFSLIAFPMVAFVILGLVETANNMSDPFGQDLSLNFNQNAIANSMYEESKKLCEEPDEDFLDHLGDPAFNPTRNPDGSLSAAAASPKELPKEEKIPNAVVQGYIAQRDQLKYDIYTLGLKYVTKEMAILIGIQTMALSTVVEMDRIPAALQAQSITTLRRITHIEDQMEEYLAAVQHALRGDPYELRYADANELGPSGSLMHGGRSKLAGAHHPYARHYSNTPAQPQFQNWKTVSPPSQSRGR